MSRRRVVVTGTAVVTSLGCDVDEVWTKLCEGHSGIGLVQRFDTSDYKVHFGGEIRDFDPCSHMQLESKDIRRMDRFSLFALVAAEKAIAQSGIDFSVGDPYRHGVIVGSGIGGLDEIELQHSRLFDRGPDRVSAFMIPKLMINAAGGNISVQWGLCGPNYAISTACASGTNAIGDAFRLIRSGMADVMVTGGSEAALTPMGLVGFARMNALSNRRDEPTRASRPFDRDRDGFVLSEGAGIVLLEEYEHARARGAHILAEVLGYGLSADATHMTSPDPRGTGAAKCLSLAIQDAEILPEQIDYINAHGTSTPLGDLAESAAIHSALGPSADRVAVSSTKSQLGHLLGASGGVEFVFCVKAISSQTAPPTINLDCPDQGCDLDYIPHEAREMPVRIAMKNSFGFGGHNASIVVGALR